MAETISKLLGVVVALGYLIAMAIANGGVGIELLYATAFLMFPLSLIWFPEFFGSFTGYLGRGGHIDTESPPFLISILGWMFLLAPAMLIYFSQE